MNEQLFILTYHSFDTDPKSRIFTSEAKAVAFAVKEIEFFDDDVDIQYGTDGEDGPIVEIRNGCGDNAPYTITRSALDEEFTPPKRC